MNNANKNQHFMLILECYCECCIAMIDVNTAISRCDLALLSGYGVRFDDDKINKHKEMLFMLFNFGVIFVKK